LVEEGEKIEGAADIRGQGVGQFDCNGEKDRGRARIVFEKARLEKSRLVKGRGNLKRHKRRRLAFGEQGGGDKKRGDERVNS